eukprot:Amastigsp_a177001_159.p3 type:complete len:109 gc:universal Amastigsp_a177001_159:109-435(+)
MATGARAALSLRARQMRTSRAGTTTLIRTTSWRRCLRFLRIGGRPWDSLSSRTPPRASRLCSISMRHLCTARRRPTRSPTRCSRSSSTKSRTVCTFASARTWRRSCKP